MWFHRKHDDDSREAYEALEHAKALALSGQKLRKRADNVAAELEAHKRSNGFAEMIEAMYRQPKRR